MALIAHYKMNDNAASAAVVDSTGNHDGTYKDAAGDVDTITGAVALKSDKAMVTFVFDDGVDTDYTIMKPVFDAQGEVACSAIVSDWIDGDSRLTEAEILALQTAGWEILCHSKTHADLTDGLNEAQIRTELSDSKDALEAIGCTINNFAYPAGASNGLVRGLVAEYYRSGRGISASLNEQVLRIYELLAIVADDHTELATYQGYVDTAESGNLWLIFYLHTTTSDDATAIGTLIDYIQAKGIDIVTINQGLDLAVQATGKINGALYFGGDVYGEIADDADFSPVLTPFSISAWIYMHDATNFYIASKGVYNTDGEWYFRTAGEDLAFCSFDESEDDCYIGRKRNTDLTSYENQWIHVVATSDGTKTSVGIRIYLNGTRADDGNIQSNNLSFDGIENLTHAVWIGRYDDAFPDGLIDNVRFFNHELTPKEVRRLYRAGMGEEQCWTLQNRCLRGRYLNWDRSRYR